jgi:hypothetical protein
VATTGPARLSVPLPDDARPPRIGKIRLGHSVETDKTTDWGAAITRAVADDHFVVSADDDGITLPETVAAFTAIYGAEPRQLRAMLLGDTPEANLEGAYRLYGTNKLKRRCDGVTCSERSATGGWAEQPCVCLAGKGVVGADCKLTFTLQMLLPEVPGFGIWQLDTGSEISVRRMTGFLRTAHTLRGTLTGLKFDLLLVPVQVAPGGTAKTVYVLDPRVLDLAPAAALEDGNGQRAGYELPAPIADDVRDELLNVDAEGTDTHTEPDPVLVARLRDELHALPPAARTAAREVLTAAGIVTAADRTLAAVAIALLREFGDVAADDLGGVIRQVEVDLAAGAASADADASASQQELL